MKTETKPQTAILIPAAEVQELYDSVRESYEDWLDGFDPNPGDEPLWHKPLKSWEEFFEKETGQSGYCGEPLTYWHEVNQMLTYAAGPIDDQHGHMVDLWEVNGDIADAVMRDLEEMLFAEGKPFAKRKLKDFIFLIGDWEAEILAACPDFIFYQYR